ncbi:MAG: DUF5131 family protein [Bryobacteraceae bacterium]|jgi:protein gp37
MAIETEIGWCDSSVNPVVGCDGCELHRAGCAESHCYAAGLVGRYKGLPGWPKSFDVPEHFAGRLDKAIGWPDLTGKDRAGKPWLNGYPRLIFMCDLADPFSESLDPEWLTPYLPKMAKSPHVYIMLTKRGRRMLSYWQKHEIPRNVWQGVTVTGPETANRLDSLMAVPGASVRFASMEPLLGPPVRGLGNLDWVIVGGESGAGARPMNPQWARELRDLCQKLGRAYFFKQWGGWVGGSCDRNGWFYPQCGPAEGRSGTKRLIDWGGGVASDFAGKKGAGRLLDGREWSEMPRIA